MSLADPTVQAYFFYFISVKHSAVCPVFNWPQAAKTKAAENVILEIAGLDNKLERCLCKCGPFVVMVTDHLFSNFLTNKCPKSKTLQRLLIYKNVMYHCYFWKISYIWSLITLSNVSCGGSSEMSCFSRDSLHRQDRYLGNKSKIKTLNNNMYFQLLTR